MNLVIRSNSDKPIYEQITTQIKEKIMNQELKSGTALPSIRLLAKDLKVSVITTKRAYEDLEKEGFIVTVPGKGSYVAEQKIELLKESYRVEVESKLEEALILARAANIDLEEIIEMMRILGDES